LENTTESFFEIFTPIADYVSIDNIYAAFKNVDYTGLITSQDTFGKDIIYKKSEYCPYPFFQLSINADGTIKACCDTQDRNVDDFLIGDVKIQNLFDVWNGSRLNFIRNGILKKGRKFSRCKECKIIDHLAESDIIDDHIVNLREKFSENTGKVKGKVYANN
jgi:radical SAM protein with 4Fe4S-binding SPASM domain